MIVTVDPAPGKAYLAVVSITSKKAFTEKLQKTSSRELALDLTSPLRKSFSARSKKDEEALCFFVSKDEGELYTYGDSNALARRQLGSYDYSSFKKVAHHALRNLMDVTYIPKIVPRTGLEIEVPRSAPQPAVIPDQPIPRATAHEQQDPPPEQDTIAFRRAHNRILPQGMFMSALAYENAVRSGQLDFWALREGVHAGADGTQIPTLTYIEKLDLSKGYEALLRQRDRILAEQKDKKIRFQTYVSQSGDVAFEDLE